VVCVNRPPFTTVRVTDNADVDVRALESRTIR
jgi:hypothetical protein